MGRGELLGPTIISYTSACLGIEESAVLLYRRAALSHSAGRALDLHSDIYPGVREHVD